MGLFRGFATTTPEFSANWAVSSGDKSRSGEPQKGCGCITSCTLPNNLPCLSMTVKSSTWSHFN